MAAPQHRQVLMIRDLTVLTPLQRQRHSVVRQHIIASIRDTQELPDGFALRLPGDVRTMIKAAEFITRERLCSPFLSFALQVEGAKGPVWLKLTGGEGVKQFLLAEFIPKGKVGSGKRTPLTKTAHFKIERK